MINLLYIVYVIHAYIHTRQFIYSCRQCEYDDDELEYWVNIRTSGTLAREDLQRLSITQTHEGQGGVDINMDLDGGPTGGFGDLTGEMPEHLALEGDANLSAPSLKL